MSRGMSRAERLREMERLYVDRAFTDIEMAERLGVDRITVYKDRALLEDEVPFVEVERGRWKIDRTRYLSSIRLSLHEALALYLPARRAARQTLIAQPHVANALEKLATALKQPMTERLVKAANVILSQSAQPERVAIMETIARGWTERLKVRIAYRGLRARQTGHHLVSPYLIEPALWSDGAYIIGHSDYFDDDAVFKIERIEQATLTRESFDIPEKFDEQELLRYAWGIWRGEGEPERVVLRFAPGEATRRVKESIWHPQQEPIRDLPNGGCEWAAHISEWQEMIPWIRGWGADCEVLEPQELRETLMQETRRMASLYQVGNLPTPPVCQLLWAKTNDEKTRTHPLICHMIDVAQVTLALWKHVLTEGIRTQICATLGTNDDDTAHVIAFWSGLHDLGKASPAFQRQYAPAVATLTKAGLDFETQVGQSSCRHDIITTYVLAGLLVLETGLPEEWANQVAITVGGHHGTWATSQDLDKYAAPSQVGGKNWHRVRQELVQRLKKNLHVPSVSLTSLSAEQINSFFTLLGGFTSTADWIGSQQQYFAPVFEDVNFDEYTGHTEQKALQALNETGWIGWQPPTAEISFGTLCNVKQLRPLQEASVALADKLNQPALVIIEAPTGVGKTEAALYLADHWARVLRQRGMYVAMPTMATSNQMFKRVRQVLERRYPSELVNYQLLHGNALLMNEEQVPRLTKGDKGDDLNIVAALEWFTKRKRGLLAPFGVGTVDQTLMSILQTRHFFVRLFGLSHKTVIFDEVHAYDTYMDELFYLLLRWLRAVGASVVILSATLSNVSRRRILAAYNPELKEIPAVSYPAITWTAGDTVQVIPLTAETRTVAVEPIGRDPAEIAHRLTEELQDGGCAAVICNTVRRAQEIYRAINDAKIVPDDDLILFHARFPWEWREEIERDVLARFGKPENGEFRSHKKAIVVATQVIEQSLDLDFDLMISDLAPIDLLIQRIGRLHRHSENDDQRPVRLKEKRVLIAMPEIENNAPRFERGETRVYEKYFLMRSWAVLRQQDSITTPDKTQEVIEAVYGDESLLPKLSDPFLPALSDAKEKMENTERKAQSQARSKLISPPDDEFMLEQSNAGLEEDNPALHEYRQAATRLAPPSITLICLYKTPNGLALDRQTDSTTIDLSQEPDRALTPALLNRKVEVADYRVVKYFANQEPPTGWRKNAWLRFARAVDFSEGGEYSPNDEKWKLKLDRKLGLIVEDV